MKIYQDCNNQYNSKQKPPIIINLYGGFYIFAFFLFMFIIDIYMQSSKSQKYILEQNQLLNSYISHIDSGAKFSQKLMYVFNNKDIDYIKANHLQDYNKYKFYLKEFLKYKKEIQKLSSPDNAIFFITKDHIQLRSLNNPNVVNTKNTIFTSINNSFFLFPLYFISKNLDKNKSSSEQSLSFYQDQFAQDRRKINDMIICYKNKNNKISQIKIPPFLNKWIINFCKNFDKEADDRCGHFASRVSSLDFDSMIDYKYKNLQVWDAVVVYNRFDFHFFVYIWWWYFLNKLWKWWLAFTKVSKEFVNDKIQNAKIIKSKYNTWKSYDNMSYDSGYENFVNRYHNNIKWKSA